MDKEINELAFSGLSMKVVERKKHVIIEMGNIVLKIAREYEKEFIRRKGSRIIAVKMPSGYWLPVAHLNR